MSLKIPKEPLINSTVHISKLDGTCYQWHGQNGPVVVLIHGLGLNRNMWRWQIPALSKHYRVLSYDLIGHGESPNADKQVDLKLFSRQLLGMLNEHQVESCTMIGFSLGGMIARRFAIDHCKRLASLVILNSPHTRSEEQQQAIIRRVEKAAKHGPLSTVEAALERWFTDDFRRTNSAVVSLVKQWVLANDPRSYFDSYRVLASGVAELVAPDPPIQCPTLVVTAQHDFGQPAHMAYAMAAEIPNAQTIVVPDLRHMALVEAPENYNQLLLRFLDDTIRDGCDSE